MFCPRCRNPLAPDQQFCDRCGADLAFLLRAPGRVRIGLAVSIGLGLVLFLLLGGLVSVPISLGRAPLISWPLFWSGFAAAALFLSLGLAGSRYLAAALG